MKGFPYPPAARLRRPCRRSPGKKRERTGFDGTGKWSRPNGPLRSNPFDKGRQRRLRDQSQNVTRQSKIRIGFCIFPATRKSRRQALNQSIPHPGCALVHPMSSFRRPPGEGSLVGRPIELLSGRDVENGREVRDVERRAVDTELALRPGPIYLPA